MKMEPVQQSRDRVYTYAPSGRIRSWYVTSEGSIIELQNDQPLAPAHQQPEPPTEPNVLSRPMAPPSTTVSSQAVRRHAP